MIDVRRTQLPARGFAELCAEAVGEGYLFIDRLRREWDDGTHRFARRGEALLGAFAGEQLVGIGALVQDPFADPAVVGRLRHIYVRPSWRRMGVGTAITAGLIEAARPSFHLLVLKAQDAASARIYERLGFVASADPNATHELSLQATKSSS
jgi:GNAT superfamily N-acetyltransferase